MFLEWNKTEFPDTTISTRLCSSSLASTGNNTNKDEYSKLPGVCVRVIFLPVLSLWGWWSWQWLRCSAARPSSRSPPCPLWEALEPRCTPSSAHNPAEETATRPGKQWMGCAVGPPINPRGSKKHTHVDEVSVDVVSASPISVQTVGEFDSTVVVWEREGLMSFITCWLSRSCVSKSGRVAQWRTGQYVYVSVLAFVVGVIGAVCSNAHLHRARLHLLKINIQTQICHSEEAEHACFAWFSVGL